MYVLRLFPFDWINLEPSLLTAKENNPGRCTK